MGVEAFVERSDQRHAHAVFTGVTRAGIPREETPGQHADVLLGVEPAPDSGHLRVILLDQRTDQDVDPG